MPSIFRDIILIRKHWEKMASVGKIINSNMAGFLIVPLIRNPGLANTTMYTRFCIRCYIKKSSGSEEDPKYVFSRPPPGSAKVGGSGSGKNSQSESDTKHFFTKPQLLDGNTSRNQQHHQQESDTDSHLIGQAIAQHRKRRRRQTWGAIFTGTFGTLFGYYIGYKVLYLDEESFIPIYPSSRMRKPSRADLRKIDVQHVKKVSKLRVLEKLSEHNMIKEEYGVPLHDSDDINPPKVKEFSIWCEDQDPCVTGLVIRRDQPDKPTTHTWYRIPYIFQWRTTHRPIYISRSIGNFFRNIGFDYSNIYEIITPEKVYGSFKYEYPIPGDDHSLHIWFLGEMQLSKDTLIVYKGKYHVDVKLEQIDLLRKENGKLVRYVLYKGDD